MAWRLLRENGCRCPEIAQRLCLSSEGTKAEPTGRLTEAIIVVGELKPRVAQTVVRPNRVLASPVSARMPLTLVHIYQGELDI